VGEGTKHSKENLEEEGEGEGEGEEEERGEEKRERKCVTPKMGRDQLTIFGKCAERNAEIKTAIFLRNLSVRSECTSLSLFLFFSSLSRSLSLFEGHVCDTCHSLWPTWHLSSSHVTSDGISHFSRFVKRNLFILNAFDFNKTLRDKGKKYVFSHEKTLNTKHKTHTNRSPQ
jgi:hypothetical protein